MKKISKNKKGFTLMEMLIVVAIIVILVAVSMPVFTSQLEKTRKAADDANERAAKAAMVAKYLDPDGTTIIEGKSYYYNAEKGIIVENATAAADKNQKYYGKLSGHNFIKVTLDSNGGVTTEWE